MDASSKNLLVFAFFSQVVHLFQIELDSRPVGSSDASRIVAICMFISSSNLIAKYVIFVRF